MPLLDLSEQRLDPDHPFAKSFLISCRGMITTYPLHIVLKEGPKNVTPTATGGAFRFHWTHVTDGGFGAINHHLIALASAMPKEHLILRTNITLAFGIKAKTLRRIKGLGASM